MKTISISKKVDPAWLVVSFSKSKRALAGNNSGISTKMKYRISLVIRQNFFFFRNNS